MCNNHLACNSLQHFSTSAMPIGLIPGFLYNGIKRHTRNASRDDDRFSAIHNFLITSAKLLHNSFVLPQI